MGREGRSAGRERSTTPEVWGGREVHGDTGGGSLTVLSILYDSSVDGSPDQHLGLERGVAGGEGQGTRNSLAALALLADKLKYHGQIVFKITYILSKFCPKCLRKT